jgi:hypothetical protein
LAHPSDFAFVEELLTFGEDSPVQAGDLVEFDPGDLETTSGERFPSRTARVVKHDGDTLVLRDPESGTEDTITEFSWLHIRESPSIGAIWEKHQHRPDPDGVAYGDGLVDPALIARLRAGVQRLCDAEPVDYHPGSGTRVRDLVHPSLYPYIAGRSQLVRSVPTPPAASYDRFGRPFEGSRYQWLPTPFQVGSDGNVRIEYPINNLDRDRHPALYDDLADLFATALPLVESVVGYVDRTQFFCEECEGIEHEGELPEDGKPGSGPVESTSLRGRDLLVIPKIVEYRLGAGETHEGVWHVEGMSHEHIVATCVYILDRDDALQGGDLAFKRAYTVEEAGRLFWNIDQSRPRPIEEMVDEGTIPVGRLSTPCGRLLVFPNSHIHKLGELRVADGASEGRRRVIVFWIVDPQVQIASTAEVLPQQGSIPHEEALAIRLELMEERKRHKQTLNVRAVSLCEH